MLRINGRGRIFQVYGLLMIGQGTFVPGADAQEAPKEVRLMTAVQDGTVGVVDGPDEYQFGNIVDLAVDRDGNLLVLDQMFLRLQVFDTLGTYLRTIGREGPGPGEFLFPRHVASGPDGSIVVSDDRKRAFTLYSSDGAVLGTVWSSTGGHYFDGISLDAEHRVFEGMQGWGETKDNSLVMSIPFFGPNRKPDSIPIPMRVSEPILISTRIGYYGYVPQPFAVRTLWDVLPDGRVVATNGHSCELIIIGLSASETISCEAARVPIPEENLRREIERTQDEIRFQARAGQASPYEFLDQVSAPSHYPTIQHLTVDAQGRIWIAIPLSQGGHLFKVFASDGTLLAHVEFPQQPDFRLDTIVVGGGWMYGVGMLDKELLVQEVRRFRIPGL